MNRALTWFHFLPFARNVKSVNHNFPAFPWFWAKNWLIKLELAEITWFRCKQKIHYIEMKRNMILWNAKNCFQVWIFREREFTDPSSLVDTVYLKRLQNLVVLFSNLEVDFANFYPYVHVLSTYFSMWHYSDKSPNNCIRKLKTTGGCFRTLCYSTPSLDSAKLQYIMLESIHTPFSSVLSGVLGLLNIIHLGNNCPDCNEY